MILDFPSSGLILSCDSTGFQVMKRTVVKERKEGDRGKAPLPENIGQEREKVLGYYGCVRDALKGLLKHGLLESDVQTVDELTILLATIYDEIERVPQMFARHIVELAEAEAQLQTVRRQIDEERRRLFELRKETR